MIFGNPQRFLDERFFEHRRRSTSIGGMAGALTAGGLFLYRQLIDHALNWDLFAVLVVMASTKIGMMVWYRLTR
jgi:hypothetical protein